MATSTALSASEWAQALSTPQDRVAKADELLLTASGNEDVRMAIAGLMLHETLDPGVIESMQELARSAMNDPDLGRHAKATLRCAKLMERMMPPEGVVRRADSDE